MKWWKFAFPKLFDNVDTTYQKQFEDYHNDARLLYPQFLAEPDVRFPTVLELFVRGLGY